MKGEWGVKACADLALGVQKDLREEIVELKDQLMKKEDLLRIYRDEEKHIGRLLGDEDLTIIGIRAWVQNNAWRLK